jgi:protein TonB
VIDKGGGISRLHAVSGYCSLTVSALDAVKQWRYSPTLLMDKPVEIDTTIDVIFSLR